MQLHVGYCKTAFCCSRKHSYPSHRGFFSLNLPPVNSSFASYFSLKILAFETPLHLRITFFGVDLVNFWSCTLQNLWDWESMWQNSGRCTFLEGPVITQGLFITVSGQRGNKIFTSTYHWLIVVILIYHCVFFFSYLLTELMDIYRKDEEKDVQNKTGPDQGGFIELTSHKTTKENTGKSSCCSSS